MFGLIKSLFLIFPTLIQILSLLANLLKAIGELSNQKNFEDVKQRKEDTDTPEGKTSLVQEEKDYDKNSVINQENLIELENRSFFVIRCKNNFYSLDESLRKLPPEIFKEKYLDFCEKGSIDTPETKSELTEDIESITKQKNVLINKIYFILNKYGLSKDFDMLPQEIKELDPEDFKEYAKKNF
ncbi:TP-like protein [Thermus phage phiYS40]|uniref:TP-like protein n=1 Tax=Thermus phage phiYS40 TaxID=407392 RepID=UPI0000E689B7|nr:TP-like protein [Thermus phage phiYS40]ABJ91459.1 TP-like protein [Thermus phage phiYS40]BAK53583.1 TP-like protein [Thermus phage phiYS40]